MARGNALDNLGDNSSFGSQFSNPFGHSVTCVTAYECWLELLKRTMNIGRTIDSSWQQQIRCLFSANYTFSSLWSSDVAKREVTLNDKITSYVKHAYGVIEEGKPGYESQGAASYDYPEIIKEQLNAVIEKLQDEWNSNSAIIQIASVSRYNRPSSPCLTYIKFSIMEPLEATEGALKLLVQFNFRSHDLFKAFMPNMALLCYVGNYVAGGFVGVNDDVEITYCGTSDNLHIYQSDIYQVEEQLLTYNAGNRYMQMPYCIPGNHLISYFEETLKVPPQVPVKDFYPQVYPAHYDYIIVNNNNLKLKGDY